MNAVVNPSTSMPVSVVSPATTPESIPGPKIILFGDSGTGKTFALKSLVPAGVTPFVIATEQNFIQVMKEDLGKTVHYKFINAKPVHGLDSVIDMVTKINKLSYENLCKTIDPFRQQHNKFLDVLTTANQFICDCCKQDWGAVASWGTDRAFVVDSLSGLSDMAFGLVVGNKPVRALPDYGVAQQALKMFLDLCTTQVKCMFILISHFDREKDEITGGTTITLKTVGNKLGPDLPRMFSDVIRARREGTTYSWDTADSQSTVVARHIPTASNQLASFVPLLAAWKARGGAITPTAKT